jgi:glucose-1-phosphate adenylyltransferase
MASHAAGIIFSSLNNNTLSRLTNERTVAAIPFACRYRLIDFCMSNMVNSDISNINIVANYNFRSLTEHIGSGKDWDLARRERTVNIISPFQTANSITNSKMYSTHMEALKSVKEYISEFKEEYVVLMDSDHVLNIDINEVVKAHEESGASITIVTHRVNDVYTSKAPRLMLSSTDGKITNMVLSAKYNEGTPELCLNIFVMRTSILRILIEQAEAYNYNSLTTMLLTGYKSSNFRAYCYDGYVASVSSFLDYYKCSMEIAKNESARESLLWKREAPVYTRVHNSAPTIYKENAVVENSMIADDCVIEGTVINSVIFRGVKVSKGATVKNSVLFKGTSVGENAELNCIVTDKDVTISDNVILSGNDNMPFYVQKSRKV